MRESWRRHCVTVDRGVEFFLEKVVIKSMFYRWTKTKFCGRVFSLYSLGENVCHGVTNTVESRIIFFFHRTDETFHAAVNDEHTQTGA